MKRLQTVQIAKDVPKDIVAVLQQVDGTKISDSKLEELVKQARKDVQTKHFSFLGFKKYYRDYLKLRKDWQTRNMSINQIPQETIDFINEFDWTYIVSNTNSQLVKIAKNFMKKWIKNNIPMKK